MSAVRSENTPVPAPSFATLASTIKDGIEAVLCDPASTHRVTVLSRVDLIRPGFRVDFVAGRGYVIVDDRWSTWSLSWELAS